MQHSFWETASPPNRGRSRPHSLKQMIASDLLMVYAWNMHGVYMVYTLYILSDSKSCLLSAIEWLSWNAMLRTRIYNSSNNIASLKACKI